MLCCAYYLGNSIFLSEHYPNSLTTIQSLFTFFFFFIPTLLYSKNFMKWLSFGYQEWKYKDVNYLKTSLVFFILGKRSFLISHFCNCIFKFPLYAQPLDLANVLAEYSVSHITCGLMGTRRGKCIQVLELLPCKIKIKFNNSWKTDV